RELGRFLAAVRGGRISRDVLGHPDGALRAVRHASDSAGRRIPDWGMINNQLWRWNNNATAGWTLGNTANITGGGGAEATKALAMWTGDPHSNINYTLGGSNTIDLNATSVCGQSGCLSGAGVIGCGGPGGGGSNTWRGDTYATITSGFVQLRSYCTFNGY